MGEAIKKEVVESGKSKLLSHSLIADIEKRQALELVFAFCGQAGSGISTVAKKMEEILENEFGYKVEKIKISRFIVDAITEKKIPITVTETELADSYMHIRKLQDGGNALREKYSSDILAQFAVKKMAVDRQSRGDKEKAGDSGDIERRTNRVAYLIDSLKHPEEVELLQMVYGSMFYLFGVLCPYDTRKKRLMQKGMTDPNASEIMERDKDENIPHGQHLIKTLKNSDFFIRNNHPILDPLKNGLERFVHLILGTKIATPTKDEYGMYIAQSSAFKSACLSRQVGAALMNSDGDVIATGCNDVPKCGGGLYTADDENDMRCFRKADEQCQNNYHKNLIKSEVLNILNQSGLFAEENEQLSSKIVGETRIADLIEFSRAVHAEMDAIISAARNPSVSTKGTILYTTVFPCHYCAHHIIAAGISKVFYIEPYEKSLAIELHDDDIAVEGHNGGQKVIFEYFEGVAPRQYQNMFRIKKPRKKKEGQLINVDQESASPIIPQFLDSFIDFEAKVIKWLDTNF